MRRPRSQSRASSCLEVGAVLLVVLMCTWTLADALMCFQCATTSADHECIDDWSGLVNTSKGEIDYYAKNCTNTNPNWTRCMIENVEFGGKLISFHRGCHDGKTFETYPHPKFENHPANNETTCATLKSAQYKLVCYSFCETDFCNGPQIPPNKTDPCEDYDNDPYGVTLPPGVICGVGGIHETGGPMGVQIAILVVISLVLVNYPELT